MGGFRILGGGSAGGVAPGGINFRKDLSLGVEQKSRLTALSNQAGSFSVQQSPASLFIDVASGVTAEPFATGESIVPLEMGIDTGTVLVQNSLPEKVTGVNVTEFLNYQGTRYAASVINDVAGADDFNNPANAQGAPDGSLATRSGQVLSATQAVLKADTFETIGTTKDQLNIDLVELRWYAQQSGTALNNGTMRFRYGLGEAFGSSSIAVTFTGNENFLSAPYVHDVTAEITGWDDIRGMNMWVEAVMDLAENLITVSVDAFEIYVEASIVG